MKIDSSSEKQAILAIATFVILILLILIQINWMFRAARLEENNFTHRVSMALKGSRDEIGSRLPYCNDMSDFLCMKKCSEDVHDTKYRELDSIINSNLNIYNIDLPYTFEITDSLFPQSKGIFFKPATYRQNLNGLIDQDGVQIRVLFPTRNQFLIAQLWSQLGLSILFILFVMVSFFITWRLFRREKNMMLSTSDFINNMVHEFQTPIANIRFATNLLAKNRAKENPEKQLEYTQVIQKEAMRLQSHVETLLKLSSGSENVFNKELIDMHRMIKQVAETFSYNMEDSGAELGFDLEASDHFIEGEPEQISHSISNLIDNALKYASSNPLMKIETRNKDNYLIVSIIDNGIGIRKEDQARIFDKFYRVYTGDVHNIKGFGLGLAYVKKIVEQHRGFVEVESSIAKGSKFSLYFPTTEKNG